MLQIGTTELAKRLYAVWFNYEFQYGWRTAMPATWSHLNTNEQRHWKLVAEEAARLVVAAMDGSVEGVPLRFDYDDGPVRVD